VNYLSVYSYKVSLALWPLEYSRSLLDTYLPKFFCFIRPYKITCSCVNICSFDVEDFPVVFDLSLLQDEERTLESRFIQLQQPEVQQLIEEIHVYGCLVKTILFICWRWKAAVFYVFQMKSINTANSHCKSKFCCRWNIEVRLCAIIFASFMGW